MLWSIPRLKSGWIALDQCRVALLCAAVAIGLGELAPIHAAGCRYQAADELQLFDAGVEGRFADLCLWTTGPVLRIYEAGRFAYFQVATFHRPCDGPQCGGSDRAPQFTQASTIEAQRLVLIGEVAEGRLSSPDLPRRLWQLERSAWTSPAPDGLLRPPCLEI